MEINRNILLQIAKDESESDWRQIIAVDISDDIIFYKGWVWYSQFEVNMEKQGFTDFKKYNEYLIKFKMNLL